MSALDSNTDIAIAPFVEQHFNLAIAAMAATDDEPETYDALGEAVVNSMSETLPDSEFLDIWLTEGSPEPSPEDIDPSCGVWSRIYAGLADEISRMIGAADIADMIGAYDSLGVGEGSIIAVTDDGWGPRAYHVSERAYEEDTPAMQRTLRYRATVPLPEDEDLPARGLYEITSVDTATGRVETSPVDPIDVPIPPSIRQ